ERNGKVGSFAPRSGRKSVAQVAPRACGRNHALPLVVLRGGTLTSGVARWQSAILLLPLSYWGALRTARLYERAPFGEAGVARQGGSTPARRPAGRREEGGRAIRAQQRTA